MSHDGRDCTFCFMGSWCFFSMNTYNFLYKCSISIFSLSLQPVEKHAVEASHFFLTKKSFAQFFTHKKILSEYTILLHTYRENNIFHIFHPLPSPDYQLVAELINQGISYLFFTLLCTYTVNSRKSGHICFTEFCL